MHSRFSFTGEHIESSVFQLIHINAYFIKTRDAFVQVEFTSILYQKKILKFWVCLFFLRR